MCPVFNILDYGAKPEKNKINTKEIQTAIDECSKSGGGTVYCPAGTFTIGTIYLKSNINLHLESGCKLFGSPNREDYEEDVNPESVAFTKENVSNAHLIIAYCIEDISITGRGVIDGNNAAFIPFEKLRETGKWNRKAYDWRPGQMVYFCKSKNISIQNISLIDPPYWTLFLHNCENINVADLHIENSHETPNGDGIDIDCCRNVVVSGCNISSGDDAITLRANTEKLGKDVLPCENVVIENCILSSAACAVRVGVGEGTIKNCSLNNIVIHNTRHGLNFFSKYGQRIPNGVTISNIRCSNMVIDAESPFIITTGCDGLRPIDNISFSDMIVNSRKASYIGGEPENMVSGIKFSNIDYTINNGKDNEKIDNLPELSNRYPAGGADFAKFPAGISLAYVDGIEFNNFHIKKGNIEGMWEHLMQFNTCKDISLTGCKFEDEIINTQKSQLALQDCKDIAISNCTVENSESYFAEISKSITDSLIVASNCNFIKCKNGIKADIDIIENNNITATNQEITK